MLEVFVLLFFCWFVAALYTNTAFFVLPDDMNGALHLRHERPVTKLLFIILAITLICFAGLRTNINDTALYIVNFNNISSGLSSIKEIDWSIGSNPLFKVYQIILKTFISNSGNTFIFITAVFVTVSNLMFIRKYSVDFGLSIFIFIAFGVYGFTLAAIKQTMATAICIWTVPLIMDKKYVKAVLLIVIGMLFHPYVIIFAAIPFFANNIWDKKAVMLIIAVIICAFAYDFVMVRILGFTAAIGDEYSAEGFQKSDMGVNIFRFLVYMVIPVLSFIYRKNIREFNNKFINIAINTSLISLCFMVFARMGNAIMFGRMADYFNIFQCLALPYMLEYAIHNKRTRRILLLIAIPCYCIFYYKSYAKRGTGLFQCYFSHISIIDLIRRW